MMTTKTYDFLVTWMHWWLTLFCFHSIRHFSDVHQTVHRTGKWKQKSKIKLLNNPKMEDTKWFDQNLRFIVFFYVKYSIAICYYSSIIASVGIVGVIVWFNHIITILIYWLYIALCFALSFFLLCHTQTHKYEISTVTMNID